MNKEYLSKTNSDCIKGIFAILIILHHILQFHTIPMSAYLHYLTSSLGYLSVAVFFFISGYGLEASFLKKEDYLKTFLRHRILPTYGTYLYVMIIYLLCFLAVGRRFSVSTLLKSVLLYSTIVNNGWFFFAILALYLIFYLSYRFLKKHSLRIFSVTLGLILWCVLCILFQFGYWIYLSVFAFLSGILWSDHKEKIDSFAKTFKGWLTGLLLLGGAFCVTWVFGHIYRLPEAVYLLFQMLSAALFPGLVMWLCMRIPVNCAVTRFLGYYSKYIYAMHGLVLTLFVNEFPIKSAVLYTLLSLFLSILLAVFVQKAARRLKSIGR